MMEGYAECRQCGNGVLVPFYSSSGENVYFCTHCRSRFSGYLHEPSIDGIHVFSDTADYSQPGKILEEGLPGGKLLDEYRSILEEFPPISVEKDSDSCPYCGGEIEEYDGLCRLCWLPVE